MVSAPDPAGRERGDDEAGLAVIRLWLIRAGIPIEGLALHDGSGLSRLNLVTPESISRLLVSLSKTATGPVFRQSLPVSGRDGTLGGRLDKVSDQVSAKTGSLTYDTSLSGYIEAPGGEVLAFSIICNDQTGTGSSTRLIDQIVSLLISYPASKACQSQHFPAFHCVCPRQTQFKPLLSLVPRVTAAVGNRSESHPPV